MRGKSVGEMKRVFESDCVKPVGSATHRSCCWPLGASPQARLRQVPSHTATLLKPKNSRTASSASASLDSGGGCGGCGGDGRSAGSPPEADAPAAVPAPVAEVRDGMGSPRTKANARTVAPHALTAALPTAAAAASRHRAPTSLAAAEAPQLFCPPLARPSLRGPAARIVEAEARATSFSTLTMK